jgi:hypothetical protein
MNQKKKITFKHKIRSSLLLLSQPNIIKIFIIIHYNFCHNSFIVMVVNLLSNK